MNAKTCKKLRRLAGANVPTPTPRYLPTEYYDRWMEVQDLELDAHGDLPTNPDGTPKMKRFDYLVVKPIRVNPESPRGRYLDLKRGDRGFARFIGGLNADLERQARTPTYSSTGLSIRVNA